jgi:pimeloyl-ACP methyl ester carboxylesterase
VNQLSKIKEISMGYIERDNTKLYYETYGYGEPIVFIEGLAQQVSMWKYQIEALKNSFKIVTFDLRGSGRSDKPQKDYSLEIFVEDTKAIIDQLNLEKPNILGVSLGGFIAQAFAVKYGDIINNLILVNTSFGGPQYILPNQDVLNVMIYGGKGNSPIEKAIDALSYSFSEDFLKNHKNTLEEIATELLKIPQPAYAYQGQAIVGATFNMENEVKNIKNKTLVIVADKDRVVPMENGLNLHKAIPNSKLVIIKNAGHLSFIEKHEEFNKTIMNFLKESKEEE